MAPDLAALAHPTHTVLVTQECQNSVIGARSVLPELAAAASATMIPNANPVGAFVVRDLSDQRVAAREQV